MGTRLRKLRITGAEFVWTAQILYVHGERDCHRCIRLRVWGAGKNSRALQVDLLSKTWGTPWSPCTVDNAYPEPRDVRAVVEYALAHGWDPQVVGGTFFLSEREHSLELDDFLCTDRLRDPTAPDPTERVIHSYERESDAAAPAQGQ